MPHTPVARLLFLLPSLVLLVFVPRGAAQDAPAQAQTAPPAAPAAPERPPFDVWLEDLIGEARTRGFSEGLITEALVGLEPRPQVIASDRAQAELAPSFNRYLNARVTPAMTLRGKEAARIHRTLLDRIEREYGVQRRFVLAIWALESRFGRVQGRIPIFQALATLAWDPRRSTFFRGELFNALMMVDRGYIDAASMTGSWAGAMGQTQFMPSSYLSFAVDFDEDGKRDIWSSTPDALASIANYLKGGRWNDEETWGREVRVSAGARKAIATIPRRTGGCSARRSTTERKPLAEWSALGLRRRDGGPLPAADVDASFVDVGERAFLVYSNYDAILGYNCAHFYALTVGMLGDSFR